MRSVGDDPRMGYPEYASSSNLTDCLLTDFPVSSLVNKIKLLCVLASEEGLKHVQAEFPGLEVRIHLSFGDATSELEMSP